MKKDFLILLLLILPAFSVLLQKGYFPMHDDLQSMRQYQLNRCFEDGQIPCRWVPDMGYGYGYPLFNFYPPWPYLLGHPIRLLGFSYQDTVKVVGISGFIFTAVGMYLLGRHLWGKRGGLISSLLYSYAPYHSVDFYVRGAMNEFWAMAFFPWILYCSLKLIRQPGLGWSLLVAFFFSGLMLSHNLMLMIFTPLFAVWVLFWLIRHRSVLSLPYLIFSGLLAFGLSAFFTLPVLLEQKYAHVETLIIGYFNYLAHFIDLKQIFLRINWGYGSSELGPGDGMSFALGYLQWFLPLLALVFSVLVPRLRRHLPFLIILSGFCLFSLFLAHSRSTFIWQRVGPLQFLQFPWRFLTLAVLSSAIVGGAVGRIVPRKFLILLAVLILVLNAGYFRPRLWDRDATDTAKFSGKSWQLQRTSSIFDYLPKWAPLPPADPAGSDLIISDGEGDYRTVLKNTKTQVYEINVSSPQATVEVQTLYFPGWKAAVDGSVREIDPNRDKLLGRMIFDLTPGKHTLRLDFTATPVRRVADMVSLVSWAFLIIVSLTKMYKSRSVRTPDFVPSTSAGTSTG